MKKIFLAIAVIIIIVSCKKNAAKTGGSTTGGPCSTTDTTTPVCLMNMIASLQQQPPFNPRAEVIEYYYNSQRVFYISSNCCDQYNLLYDANCNVLCAPGGGFSGAGDGNCPDFFKLATNERQVWKDPR